MYEHEHETSGSAPELRREPPRSRFDRSTQEAVADGKLSRLRPDQFARLQRAAGNNGVADMVEEDAADSVRSAIGEGGRPLDGETKAAMEHQLGSEFSSVRVHSGTAAQRSTEAVAARAYTVGENVVLGDGVDTASESGQHTLAHELTHVVQQRQGPVDGTEAGGVKVSDPGDRFEREAEDTAAAVMAGAGPGVQRSSETEPVALRRQGEEEEEELQMQREGDEEEEELQMQREGDEEEEELQMQREGDEEEEELQM